MLYLQTEQLRKAGKSARRKRLALPADQKTLIDEIQSYAHAMSSTAQGFVTSDSPDATAKAKQS